MWVNATNPPNNVFDDNARGMHSLGAAPMTVMTHIAIQERLDGKASTR